MIRRLKTGAILAFAAILMAAPSLSWGADLEVCGKCEISTLREALSRAADGDTIIVQAGHYREGVLKIERSVRIIGRGYPIIDGLRKGHVLYIRADGVEIRGLRIINSGISYVSDFSGIRIEHSKNCVIRDNRLENNTYSIYLAKVKHCLIQGNSTRGNAVEEVSAGNGIHLFYSDHISVIKNRLSRQRDGLYFEFAEDSLVQGNSCVNNIRYGMHFMFSHRNRFIENEFRDNQTGTAIMYSRKLVVRGNRFIRSWGPSSYGLLIKEITDSVVEDNIFYANTTGMMITGANRNRFRRNLLRGNGWAALIHSNSMSNQFVENDFVSNQFDIAVNSVHNTNKFRSNYWDRYRGYDLNRDGRGDVAFRPVGVFSYWLTRFPELSVLLNSPVLNFLEVAERVFPVLTPKSLQDDSPSMKPVTDAYSIKFRSRPNADDSKSK